MRTFERLDRYLLGAVCLAILIVVAVNFTTSYGHIYVEGLTHGEYGVDARLMPIGIDGALLALGLANVFAARFQRSHWLLRSALGFGVASTVAVNGAYGATWGITGGLLATYSPVFLFITVESALYMFRVAADVIAAQEKAKPRVGRPPGVRNKTPKRGDPGTSKEPGTDLVIQGHVDPLDPFAKLRQAALCASGRLPSTSCFRSAWEASWFSGLAS